MEAEKCILKTRSILLPPSVREAFPRRLEKLYLSQPYLSQCIARTEKELGVKLFDRSHMPLKLTEAGKIYMRYLESVGVLTGQFEEQLGELKTGRSRTLNVGMTLWRGIRPAAGYPAKLL